MMRKVTILGAGLVGALFRILLRKREYEVTIYDKRPDPRNLSLIEGRID